MQLITIGRSPANRIVINDPSISNYHAEVLLGDDGSISITDKSSTNGTSVRGQRIRKETEVSINRGDMVTFSNIIDLDWSRIPILTPPPPGWQLYGIGSGLRNRIQVNDASGRISRYHATLKVDPKGKNYINDHSANGTYVNGSRIESNKDMRVRRSDKISFANVETLDWKKVVRKTSWATVAAIVAAVIVVGGGIFAYAQGWIFSSEWSLAKTYKTYSNSIVCIYHEYRVVAKTAGGKEYVLYLDKQTGELSKMKASFSQSLGGTAFFIDTEGTMVTNRHVVFPWEADMPQYVQKYKQKYSDEPEVTIAGVTLYIGVAYNNTSISRYSDLEECSIPKKKTNETLKDVALLKVKNPKQLPAKFVPVDLKNAFLEARRIMIGEPVYLIGYPPVLAASTPEGAMSTVEVKLTNQSGAVSQVPDSYKFAHNATAFDGSSGSPIFNNKGQLIGVHYPERPQAGAQSFAWGVLVKHAKELYEMD